MDMTILGDVPFGDKDAFTVFLGEHDISHQVLNTAIESKYGQPPQTFLLGDNLEVDTDWLIMHYQMHLNLQSILGLTGLPDLSDVNMKHEEEFNDWVQIHNYEHARLNAVLGLT